MKLIDKVIVVLVSFVEGTAYELVDISTIGL